MHKLIQIAALGLIVLLPAPLVSAGPRDAAWAQVEKAAKEGLPKTAIEHLDPIIEAAVKDRAWAEAIKAIGRKIAYEGNIQGNKPEEKITRMQAEIEQAPEEMKPLMEAIVAHWYWHYFQRNKWRFMQRTQTAEAPGEDFTTWALPRLFEEIDLHFTTALASAPTLKKIPVGDFDELLEKGGMPDAYRPTLYDFVAHEALVFYSSGEQAGAKPQDAFDISAESPVFGDAAAFLAWDIQTADTSSPDYKALKLYQQLMTFHREDKDPSAFLDVDLHRLEFGKNKAFGEEKNARYKARLKRWQEDHADHPLSALALHRLATALLGENELVEAHRYATEGMNRFAQSPGGTLCYNLIQQIESKSARVDTERVWNDPLPTLNLHYRNVDKVWFRLVKMDWEKRFKALNQRPEYIQYRERKNLLKIKPVKTWSVDLPATTDYRERMEAIPAPEGLEPGFYYLLASYDKDFSEQNNRVHYTSFWRSDLAFIPRVRAANLVLEGFVLGAKSGEPLAGASVRAWQYNNRKWSEKKPVKTDADGFFTMKGTDRTSCVLLVEHEGMQISSFDQYTTSRYDTRDPVFQRTVFFTDRALYRPGQTIQFKGICINVEQENNRYNTLKGREVTVLFNDVNGKEIEQLKVKTNDYGSFNGSFTAPRDRLMGRMSLRVDKAGPQGYTAFNVEEYKRPKFQVTLEAPAESARLNKAVQLTGKAMAYTGASIDDARVRWRVVREVRYPSWWGWYYWWRTPAGNAQEIAHGETRTQVDGTFELQFTATPDKSVNEKDEPTFRYTVYADVLDNSGETRSAQRVVNAGYTALKASLSAAPWLTEAEAVKVNVLTQTLDGEPLKAEGTLKIFSLQQPDKVHRKNLSGRSVYYRHRVLAGPPPSDPTNINSWELGPEVAAKEVATDDSGQAEISFDLKAGPYRAVLITKDRFGKPVQAVLPMKVLNPEAPRLALKVPSLFEAPSWTVEPGEEFMALWGSGYEAARAYVEIEHHRKVIKKFWTDGDATQLKITHPVTEQLRGGFFLRVTMVRENRAYLHSRKVIVPWSNKVLQVKWEHFTSKLGPAEKKTWSAVISGPDAEAASAEFVAGLYDASLDAYKPHNWPFQGLNVFRQDRVHMSQRFQNMTMNFNHLFGNWPVDRRSVNMGYRHYPHEVIGNFWGYQWGNRRTKSMARGGLRMESAAMDAAPAGAMLAGAPQVENQMAKRSDKSNAFKKASGDTVHAPPEPAPAPDLSKVAARKNLDETAFFFPHLTAKKDGEVRMTFTMPEALTEWKFMGFAHDNGLRSGFITDSVVTSKDLMIQPNPPRFLREGDELEFTVKVTNLSEEPQTGKVRVTFADAQSGASVDDQLGLANIDQSFDIPARESRSYHWRVAVPDELGYLTYKAVGATDKLSDGEEGYLPVLSRRVLVTESLPLPIRGKQAKTFSFDKLKASGASDSIRHKTLTVQMVSNPSWYAVMALPYLMEYPHQCSEQVFNRLYANALGQHIANSDPKIRRVFDTWKNTPGDALDSPMEKNQDLKAVMLEESPWYRQAKKESQARRNVGILFDDNRLEQEIGRALQQLKTQQRNDGLWPWFPGGRGNEYITLYITTGFGRMRHLGVDVPVDSAVKALNQLDAWVDKIYDRIKNKKNNHLSPTIALYLYGRSFFLEDRPIAKQHQEAVNYFLGQGKTYWLQLANRQSQAHLAIALNRFDDVETAKKIMRSIKERSVNEEELGMFWRELEHSWWWYRAPIETQAMMIEAFAEVMNDEQAVEDCKVWLLKQKQTQDWKTTKATADAVYALLLRGANLLASDERVEVALAGEVIKPEKVEAGTGFYQQRFHGGEIVPAMGEVTLKKVDEGVAWGSLHWQYLEDMEKVTAHSATPLKVTKDLYTKVNTAKGPELRPVKGAIAVGDELVTRITVKVDRDMEYVHLKDYRGSGTEPVNVLSRYKFQDGIYYYETTRDTASHFFIDYLPKGVYVFEYAVRVQHKGQYQTGYANIQCMYAPEFNGHSESIPLVVE